MLTTAGDRRPRRERQNARRCRGDGQEQRSHAPGICSTPNGAGSISLWPAPPPDNGALARTKTSFRWPAASVNVPQGLPTLGRINTLASWAEQLARALLREPLPRRWPTCRASPPGPAALRLFLARTLICWKPPRGCTTATHPISPPRACTNSRAPGTCATPSEPTPFSAGWLPITPASSSKLANADLLRSWPGVRACATGAFQRADLLRHDHQPGQRARASRTAARRDTAPLRPRASGEPVNPARHADDSSRRRAGQ